MREHRLIERMVGLIEAERRKLQNGKVMTPGFPGYAVDFFRTYADRTHHGKEEDILFRQLGNKNMSAEHKTIMNELVEEHKLARKLVGKLDDAEKRHEKGEATASDDIQVVFRELSALYPRHIEKEDKHFFYQVLEYFTRDEQDAMLREFEEFDRSMIHEKYGKVVEELGG